MQSHEIKTPLAIISANTDVLELDEGGNEWTQSIRSQIQRLNKLVEKLMLLAKMEEEEIKRVFAVFDLSEAVEDAAAPFETLAQSRGKTLRLVMERGLKINGDDGGIRELTAILMDNAVKYADEGSEIRLELQRQGRTAPAKGQQPLQHPARGQSGTAV